MKKNITGTTEVLTKVNNDMELTAESLDSVSGGLLVSIAAVAFVGGLYATALGTAYAGCKMFGK